ncbi:hypothetical protein QTP86_002721 [Hemibagrus guttatus]|nr:hypothetical protein QTP86_002721 [Hemibagrus guttatus]
MCPCAAGVASFTQEVLQGLEHTSYPEVHSKYGPELPLTGSSRAGRDINRAGDPSETDIIAPESSFVGGRRSVRVLGGGRRSVLQLGGGRRLALRLGCGRHSALRLGCGRRSAPPLGCGRRVGPFGLAVGFFAPPTCLAPASHSPHVSCLDPRSPHLPCLGPRFPPLALLLLLAPPPKCLALLLAPPPQVPRPAPRSPHRPLYVPSSSPGPIAGPDFLGGARTGQCTLQFLFVLTVKVGEKVWLRWMVMFQSGAGMTQEGPGSVQALKRWQIAANHIVSRVNVTLQSVFVPLVVAATYQVAMEEEDFHSNSDPRCMWKGIQTITDHKPSIQSLPTSNAYLPDELNHFFARFDKGIIHHTRNADSSTVVHPVSLSTTECLNDFCPVALTPIVMKCFEKLVLSPHNMSPTFPGPTPVCLPFE